MKVLFLHNNFPAQFCFLASALAENPENEVLFISSSSRNDIILPKVKSFLLNPTKKITVNTDIPLTPFLSEQTYRSIIWARALDQIKKEGFYPDIIVDHPGWGNTYFIKEVFPLAAYYIYCEWFYTKSADFSFLEQKEDGHFSENRLRNFSQLNALIEADLAISPTEWQKAQYPKEFQDKITVLHDGIDTNFFTPKKDKLNIPGLDLSGSEEIVTYTARGLEPYRGFPQFYKSLPRLLKKHPNCHIIIMGNDTSHYSEGEDISYKEQLKEQIPLDSNRVHFLNFGLYETYLSVLQASNVHVYLTVPFVLSWSMLEAMSCGCPLLASATDPVCEVIQNGSNGLLFNFWDTDELADKIDFLLTHKELAQNLGKKARATIINKYALAKTLPAQIALLNSVRKK